MKKHHPIFNVVRRDNQEVRQVAQTVYDEANDRSVDGIIVILARKNGKVTTKYMAGSLADPSRAAFESFTLQLAMGIGKAT